MKTGVASLEGKLQATCRLQKSCHQDLPRNFRRKSFALKSVSTNIQLIEQSIHPASMGDLRTVATKAVVLFGRCQTAIKTNPHVHVEPAPILSLSEVFGRFRLWAGNLGVFQDGHASLDWRLRESSNMSKSVLGLINDLNDNLENSTESSSFFWRC
jgi:hypothetical protein